MNIAIWLARAAQARPERVATYLGEVPVHSYGALQDRAARLASALAARGLKPGDRAALFMHNAPAYLEAMYAVWIAGGAVVPINAKLHPKEAAWILDNAEATLTVASPDLAQGLAAETDRPLIDIGGSEWNRLFDAAPLDLQPRAPDSLAWLFYTSGTTGRPKGVMITHRMLMAMSLTYQVDCDAARDEDAALYAAPLSHGAGLYSMMHVRAGAKHVFPPSRGFDPSEVMALAAFHGSTHVFLAPTMVQRLTRAARAQGQRGSGLRTVVYAGGPMYTADIVDAVDWFGPVFVQIYGQGECPMGITALSRDDVADRTHPRWQARLGSVGRAQSAGEVRIVDGAGAPVPVDTIGEIVVRGDVVMPGYWRAPDATARTLIEGWLHTGDMGSLDADGYLTLKDRSRDVIISGGSNIYPREVEDVLQDHPSVVEVAVVGRPHPEWGEEVVACVVTQGALDPLALEAHCLSRIARFKRPKHYLACDALPKNNYGKVLKTELRSRVLKLE